MLRTSAKLSNHAQTHTSFCISSWKLSSQKRWENFLKTIFGPWSKNFRVLRPGGTSLPTSREVQCINKQVSTIWAIFATWYRCCNSYLWCLSSDIRFSRPWMTALKISRHTKNARLTTACSANSSVSLVSLSWVSAHPLIHLTYVLLTKTWLVNQLM